VLIALKQVTSVIVSVIFAGQLAYAVGFTVTVAVTGGPSQVPPPFAVMVKVTVTGVAVLLVKEPLMSPLPLAGIPVTARLSLVQLYTVPDAPPLNTIVVMALPVQEV